MNAKSNIIVTQLFFCLVLFEFLITQSNLFAQAGCGPSVPTFTVNLTGNPNGSWISPNIVRNDTCCGTTSPDNCVQFIVTLDPLAQGIQFNIYSGAIPPGAMFYQINCGPAIPVGNAVCLSGVGPHYITFCKPGGNANQYIITSIYQPSAYGDSVTTNCNSGLLTALGFSEPTITWTSIFPGPQGSYNTYLSCISGCDSTVFTASVGLPAYIDYLVCGKVVTLCDTNTVCDTARVYVYAPVQLSAPGNVCAGAATASVTATPSGGATPYTYLWNPTGQTTQTATGLSAGSYTVTLTDANGCTSSSTITIYAVGNPTTTATSSNISCFGGSNGSILASSSGGTSPYSYLWNTSQTTSTISGLPVGNYSVIVTDANGCADTVYTFITEPPALTSTVSSASVACNGGNNGSATVSASGGTPSYTYSWSSGQTTSSSTGLMAGNYSATITDANGCISTASFIITEPAVLTSSSSQNNVSCSGGSNGSAAVSVSGGTTAYTYLWNNGQTTSSATNLSAGNYSVTITDANGCTTTQSFIVTEPPLLSSSASQTNICSGASNGTASVYASGGMPSYSYLWSSGQTTSSATGLSAGNYSVTVTDANGCTSVSSVTINIFPALSSVSSQNNVSCFGGSNGSVTVIPSGGTTPFTYLWNNGQTSSASSGLTAGNYSVLVTDANGCTTTQSVSITEPTLLTSSSASAPDTCGNAVGIATATASGGTPPYFYLWSNGQTTSAAVNLTAGNYSVVITDVNGCTTTATVSVTSVFAGIISTTSQTNVSCFSGNNGTAAVTTSGGASPYTYNWSSGQTSSSASGLSAGNYSVTISDANGCSTTIVFIIIEPAFLTSSVSLTNVSCSGGNNGTAAATTSGGTSPYTYSWSNGQTTPSASGLLAGNYSVTITDANGCTTASTISITQPPVLVSSASQTNVTCFGGGNGTATANASGGTFPYSFLWNNGQTTFAITGLIAGNYSVMVTDTNGCTTISSVLITEPAAITATLTSANATGCTNNGTAAANTSGGTPSYTYSWNNGQTTSSSTGLSPGNYSVTITDANGCTLIDTISLGGIGAVAANAGPDASICLTNSTTLNASGGINYSWSPSAGLSNPNISNPVTGPAATTTYTVTITDANGCAGTDTVTVTIIPAALPNFSSDSVCVNNTTTFTDLSSGNIISWSWNFGDGNISSVSTPSYIYSSAGTYTATLTLTSSNGCITSASMPVVVYPGPSALFTTTPSVAPMAGIPPNYGLTVNFINQSSGAVNYYWNFGDGATSASADPQHYYAIVGGYTITLITTNQYGCTDTFRMVTSGEGDITFPNAFTPNSSGPNGGTYNPFNNENDVFFPFASLVDEYLLMIFNRWGELVFESADVKTGWDGYYREKLCQQDVYVWKAQVKFIDGRTVNKAGDVTLLR